MQLLDIDLPIPDHTTLSRRLQTLGEIRFQPATHGPLHLLIDSTGLRIHVGHLRKPPRSYFAGWPRSCVSRAYLYRRKKALG